MDGSKKDVQAGCTGKPYWGAAKKACGVNLYGAPPMDRSKDSQAGAPAAVPAGALTTTTTSKGPATPAAGPVGALTTDAAANESAAPVVGPAGALTPPAWKVGPIGGWGRAAAVVSTTVPMGALVAAIAPTACSLEAAAA
jgi:hypothetical protein